LHPQHRYRVGWVPDGLEPLGALVLPVPLPPVVPVSVAPVPVLSGGVVPLVPPVGFAAPPGDLSESMPPGCVGAGLGAG
jgi:hypothetical protein